MAITASELKVRVSAEGVDQTAKQLGTLEKGFDRTAASTSGLAKSWVPFSTQLSKVGLGLGDVSSQAAKISAPMADATKGAEAFGSKSGLIAKMGDTMAGVTSKAAGLAAEVGKLAAVGAGIGVAGVVAFGAAAVNASSEARDAVSKLQAQLGLTADEASRLGGVALSVFKDNFAGSITEATAAVSVLAQQMPSLQGEELRTMTENAFRLKDAFGVDIKDSVSAAQTLMQQFGVTGDQAFDLVTTGFQKGLNRSGDFLDSINEYGTQFASGGATAEQFFSVLQTGMQGGVLGTDKAADAFKEFRVRIQDGSKTTSDALKQLGINSDDLARKMSSGQMSAADAFGLVTNKLREQTDANVIMQAGVGLLGTQFEDLGTGGALALDLMAAGWDKVGGSTAALDVQYSSLGAVFEGLKRKAIVDLLIPMGDKILALVNGAMPMLTAGFDQLGQIFGTLSTAINTGDFSGFTAKLQDIGTKLIPILQDWTGKLIGWAGEAVSKLAGSIDTWGPALLVALGSPLALLNQTVRDKLGDVLGTVISWGKEEAIPALGRAVAQWAPVFARGVADAVPPLLGALADVGKEIVSWVTQTAAPEIAGGLRDWGQAFTAWAADAVPPMLSKLGDLASEAVRWVGEQVPVLVDQLATWGAELVNWVEPRIGPMLAALGGLIERGLNWVADQVPPLIAQLAVWGAEFVAWVAPQIPPFLLELGKLAVSMIGWIGEKAPEIVSKLAEWGTAFLGFVAKDVVPFIAEKLGELLTRMGTWVATDAIPWAGRELAKVGSAIVAGIWNGITAKWDGFIADLGGLVDKLPGPIKKVLGIGSPSKVFADEVGQWIPLGIALGVEQGTPGLVASVIKMGSTTTDAAIQAMGAAGSRSINAYLAAFSDAQIVGELEQQSLTNYQAAISTIGSDEAIVAMGHFGSLQAQAYLAGFGIILPGVESIPVAAVEAFTPSDADIQAMGSAGSVLINSYLENLSGDEVIREMGRRGSAAINEYLDGLGGDDVVRRMGHEGSVQINAYLDSISGDEVIRRMGRAGSLNIHAYLDGLTGASTAPAAAAGIAQASAFWDGVRTETQDAIASGGTQFADFWAARRAETQDAMSAGASQAKAFWDGVRAETQAAIATGAAAHLNVGAAAMQAATSSALGGFASGGTGGGSIAQTFSHTGENGIQTSETNNFLDIPNLNTSTVTEPGHQPITTISYNGRAISVPGTATAADVAAMLGFSSLDTFERWRKALKEAADAAGRAMMGGAGAAGGPGAYQAYLDFIAMLNGQSPAPHAAGGIFARPTTMFDVSGRPHTFGEKGPEPFGSPATLRAMFGTPSSTQVPFSDGSGGSNASGSRAGGNVTQYNTINITQQPGENSQQLADRVMKALKERIQRQN